MNPSLYLEADAVPTRLILYREAEVVPRSQCWTSKDDAELIQLHSMGFHPLPKSMQEKLLKQIELMVVTLDEGMKVAKEQHARLLVCLDFIQ
jgi:hypothetical protein